MNTAKKLVIGACVVTGATAYMAYVGASTGWQYYVTADECVAAAGELAGQRIRVSGKVASDSLAIAADRTEAVFLLEENQKKLRVRSTGPLPDNLAEGIDVVVEGRLNSQGVLEGNKILTRCASKYRSQQPDGSPAGVTAGTLKDSR